MTPETRTEYRVAYDVRAYGDEIGTYEVPLSEPRSLVEASSRLASLAAKDDYHRNLRIEKRTVTYSPWKEVEVEHG